jgi:hypothetical protein
MPLDLQGDLSFTVDGPGGSTSGTVVGDGAVLRVRAEDPVTAWDGFLGSVSTGPAALRTVADGLADEGLSIAVSGPHGLLAVVGAGADSGVGKLLLGSRRVQLGRPAALRPLAVAQLRRSLTRPDVLAVVAGVVTAVVLRRRTRL